MTGLDFVNDSLVEIACIVTDSELNELDDGFEVVIKVPQEKLDTMDPVVTQMHTASGLLHDIPSGLTLEEAEQQLFDYVTSHVPESFKAPLAGSSVYVDRIFLRRDMPRVDSYLHYRIIDVSSLKELARRWYSRTYFANPLKTGNHRALGDTRDSINELRYYRAAIMVPEPGPDTLTARAISEHIMGRPFATDV
ncbi:MAG: oligoribonuclease [Actinobacteria bacterium]|nr:oligoribonuclease [Actinomycetota bacterium]NBY15203.1 oligoribonuclease [Actinomycetota bacterium]